MSANEERRALAERIVHAVVELQSTGCSDDLTVAAILDILPREAACGHEDFLIWSNEHGAWWAPGSKGYTRDATSAGVYLRDEAEDICRGAGRDQRGRPNEVMFPESWLRAAAGGRKGET